MKKNLALSLILLVFTISLLPQKSYATGIEVSVGLWRQKPSGDIAYKPLSVIDRLSIEQDLNLEEEDRIFARIKAELPLFFPNIYVIATPMKFENTGSRTLGDFKFGDTTFDVGVDFTTKLQLDHYDIALYYGLPFLKTSTLGKLNVEIGINTKIIDFEAEISGEKVGGVPITESKSETIVVPMIYAGIQFNPVDLLSIELEGRGIAYSSNHYYDFIGRVKIKPVGPLFIAGGYRHEDIEIDNSGVEASIKFSGPFVEGGVYF
ncbi:MAG: TIGR04219 family outer membrane beta-barrel protein [Thermodesulfovibrionia bacterium]|nr:TIGR04219 family outer membrane beta-barrel protein [Thermodesulfovibrionia bacterium]